MKRLNLSILFVFIFTFSFCQEWSPTNSNAPKNVIGFFSNIGICQPIGAKGTTNTLTFHGKEAYSIGLKYQRSISEKFSLETGISYSKYSTLIHFVDDGFSGDIYDNLSTISIPVLLRRYSPKDFFFRFGSMIEFGLSRKGEYGITDAQTGFGISIGAGKEFVLNKFSLDIAPNLDIHSIIPFSSHLFQQKLFVLGLKIGISYSLN